MVVNIKEKNHEKDSLRGDWLWENMAEKWTLWCLAGLYFAKTKRKLTLVLAFWYDQISSEH